MFMRPSGVLRRSCGISGDTAKADAALRQDTRKHGPSRPVLLSCPLKAPEREIAMREALDDAGMWRLQPLLDDVERRFGKPQRELLKPCVRSLASRHAFVRLHLDEADACLRDYVQEQVERLHPVEVMLNGGPSGLDALGARRQKAAANTVAAMQSLHAISDTVGHVVYFALGLNQDATTVLPPRGINLSSVTQKVGQHVLLDPLQAISSGPGYEYLCDAVNAGKHRSIVEMPYELTFSERHGLQGEHGLRFEAFEYQGWKVTRQHPARWARPALVDEYNRQSRCLTEDVEAVLKVDACGECVTVTGQDNRQFVELLFEPVEGGVRVGEELFVLDVHLVGVHAHDGAFVHHFNLPCHCCLLIVRRSRRRLQCAD